MTTITAHTPSPVAAPRGAALAAKLFARVLDALEGIGRARAMAVLSRMEATRATEAARLRLFAQQWERQDPRYAADLYAAADRHERS
jgi:hypothetical protein